ncbi:MAG TPA: DUF4136 domain-containing protein [Bryobacteraceae bacterium]|nr:DUF4136 domain-containing protein [Bryobacteraceae bacterium]
MKLINLAALVCLSVAGFAQDVQFDYDRSANFSAYKTYNWVDYRRVDPGDQLLDQDIKRAVDAQLADKGLRRVESGGDLVVGYQAGISQEKEFEGIGPSGWSGWGPLGWGNTRVTTSTIDIGKLTVGLFDPASKQLVWRGAASKTLNLSRDPDKNYRNLEKAVAKLFRDYPPATGKR